MTDQFPANIEFEIDRARLMRYWRIQGFVGCCGPATLLISIMFTPFFSLLFLGVRQAPPGPLALWRSVAFVVATLSGFLAGSLLYFIMAHYPAKWAATNLRLTVEGPYLRIVSGAIFVTDRRIHFRSISDYSTHDGPLLKRLGMKALSFRVIGGAQATSSTIPGIIDAVKARDLLCEIDAAREN